MKTIKVSKEDSFQRYEKFEPITVIEDSYKKLTVELYDGNKKDTEEEVKGKIILLNKRARNEESLNLRMLNSTHPKEVYIDFRNRQEFADLTKALKELLLVKEGVKFDFEEISLDGDFFGGASFSVDTKELFLFEKSELEDMKRFNIDNISQEDINYLIGNKEKIASLFSKFQNISDLEEVITQIRLRELHKFKEFYDRNINSDEKTWQNFMKENSDFLSLIFTTKTTLITDEAYVGGKDIYNKNGNNLDFLFNDKTFNLALVEIKRFNTELVASNDYRSGVAMVSKDVIGGVQQVLEYKNSTIDNFESLIRERKDGLSEESEEYRALSKLVNHGMRSILIVGNSKSLDTGNKRKAFNNFRNQLKDIEIITFDELLDKVEQIKEFICYDLEEKEIEK